MVNINETIVRIALVINSVSSIKRASQTVAVVGNTNKIIRSMKLSRIYAESRYQLRPRRTPRTQPLR